MFRFVPVLALLACAPPPDKTVENARIAVQSKNWPVLFSLCDPDQAHAFVWSEVLTAAFAGVKDARLQPKLDAIFDRYLVADPLVQPIDVDPKDALAKVQDLAALFTELMNFTTAFKPPRETFIALGEVPNKITATGEKAAVYYPTATVFFVRKRGSWYIKCK